MSTRTQYEADLAALKGSLAKMGQLSADAVEDALEALCRRTPRKQRASSRATPRSTGWSGTSSTAA